MTFCLLYSSRVRGYTSCTGGGLQVLASCHTKRDAAFFDFVETTLMVLCRNRSPESLLERTKPCEISTNRAAELKRTSALGVTYLVGSHVHAIRRRAVLLDAVPPIYLRAPSCSCCVL